ncbi:fimbrial protein [Providencia stuartii ATCC 25827]|uniref:Fimbrial protein n=2 Tax=Providencia stuartii TaxID=588 RepID=A0AA86YMQ8_PROST|nr:fimbrial protein [Providencia stuartii ATCC 25827]
MSKGWKMRATVARIKVKSPIKSLFKSMFASGLLLVSAQSIAEVFTIQVKVTVVEKTCDIYGDGGKNAPITVTFPDLVIRNIDGIAYGATPIEYQLDCEDAADNPALKIQFTGTDAQSVPNSTFKVAGKLRTTDNNLAIKINANGQQLKLNDWFPFNYKTKPQLTAVPVPSDEGGIRGGEFTASGTLSVEYQ